MSTSREQLKAKAKAVRETRIKILRACDCAWPVVEADTVSGHAANCPGHEEWKRQYGE